MRLLKVVETSHITSICLSKDLKATFHTLCNWRKLWIQQGDDGADKMNATPVVVMGARSCG